MTTEARESTKLNGNAIKLNGVMSSSTPLGASDANKGVAAVTDDDDESLSTVMSERSESSSSDDSSVGPASSSLRQLEIEFKARDKLLKQMVKGIDPVYAQILRDNEHAARKQKILLSKQKKRQRTSSTKEAKPVSSLSSKVGTDEALNCNIETVGLIQRIRLLLACDLNNTVQGAAHLILYCIAHSSCFQVMEVVITALTKDFKNQDSVAVVLILAVIVLLRLTGGMWDYLGDDSYKRVKFDMHNRLRLGKTDAHVARWFHHHPKLAIFLNLVAFYTAFESAVYLQERFMVFCEQYFVVFADHVRTLKQQFLHEVRETCATDGVCDVEAEDVLIEASYTKYYVISAVVAIYLLHNLGHPFLCRA